jgi:hypothetical protein
LPTPAFAQGWRIGLLLVLGVSWVYLTTAFLFVNAFFMVFKSNRRARHFLANALLNLAAIQFDLHGGILHKKVWRSRKMLIHSYTRKAWSHAGRLLLLGLSQNYTLAEFPVHTGLNEQFPVLPRLDGGLGVNARCPLRSNGSNHALFFLAGFAKLPLLFRNEVKPSGTTGFAGFLRIDLPDLFRSGEVARSFLDTGTGLDNATGKVN